MEQSLWKSSWTLRCGSRTRSGVDLPVYNLSQKRGEGNQMDARPQEWKFLHQIMKYRRKKIHLHVIMAADIKGKDMLLPAQPLLSGQSGFQNDLGIREKHHSFLGKRNAFAGTAEQFHIQFLFQCPDLMAHSWLVIFNSSEALEKFRCSATLTKHSNCIVFIIIS